MCTYLNHGNNDSGLIDFHFPVQPWNSLIIFCENKVLWINENADYNFCYSDANICLKSNCWVSADPEAVTREWSVPQSFFQLDKALRTLCCFSCSSSKCDPWQGGSRARLAPLLGLAAQQFWRDDSEEEGQWTFRALFQQPPNLRSLAVSLDIFSSICYCVYVSMEPMRARLAAVLAG